MKVLLLLVTALLAAAALHGSALAAPITVDLCATSGSAAMPGGATVTVWGYASGNCSTTPTVSQPGGPTIDVHVGDVVTVNLRNNLAEQTALLFKGQAAIPDLTGVAAGGTKSYTFTATNPGTYLYEAGLLDNAQHQVAMGLYGALVVRPGTAGQAYGPSTTYNDEAVLVLSEIDPALNGTPAAPGNPAAFDMRAYAPKYRLINGKAYPGTAPITVGAAGNKVLLRYVNAGLEHHSMALLGLNQAIVATDGSLAPFAQTVVADTIAPGETQDTIATVPSTAATGSKFALYEASLMLRNSSAAGSGGMLTFLTIGVGTPPGGGGPTTSGVTLTPNPANGKPLAAGDPASGNVTLSATITPGAGLSVAGAEYFADTTGANGAGCAMTISASSASATIPTSGGAAPCANLATLSSGKHTFYVHGRDSAGAWGAFSFAVLTLDKAGPATSLLTLAPNPSNASENVALSGTASDSATGGSNIAAAEYFIDVAGTPAAGSGTAMTVNAASPVANITASIAAATVNGLSQGSHVVSVRSRDALGNWGALATISLVVDKTGPTAGSLSASPNPTNGLVGYNSTTAAVRVFATFTDALSKVSAGEGFIDCQPPGVAPNLCAVGQGFIFVASDGAWSSSSEAAYADVPLSTIQQLATGSHTIYLHGKDAAGNWTTTYSTINLVVDKTNPSLTGVSLVPSTIAFGAASVTLNVTATDAGTGVAGGQYWIDGTSTPPANPTSFNGTSSTINTSALAGGNHTVHARVRDAASNWSTVSSAALVVIQAINDARTITANTNATQTADTTSTTNLLANDQPVGAASRATRIASAPVRTAGTGAGTITVSCPSTLGTAATPAISGNTVCTNGAYRITLNGAGASGNARRTSKLGAYQFTYTEVLNGATSTATVTITVN